MIDRVKDHILSDHLIEPGEKVLVSLSGGPDSVALLHILDSIKKEIDITIGAFHLNHMLRGNNSDTDESFCARLCDRYEIKKHIYKEDIVKYSKENNMSFEAAGRKRRYALLDEIKEKFDYDKVTTAHNMNDSVESVILNILRGSGLNGLLGIPVKRGYIVRPLLNIRKDEILKYIEDNDLEFVIDESNQDDSYLRNYIRNEFIKKTEERFDLDIIKSISRMSENLLDDQRFLNNTAKRIYDDVKVIGSQKISIKKDILELGDVSISKRMILKAITDLVGNVNDIEDIHLKIILDLPNKTSGACVDLPGDIIAGIDFDYIYIKKKTNDNNEEFENINVVPGMSYIISGKKVSFDLIKCSGDVNKKLKNSLNQIYIDYDRIESTDLVLRFRKEKDIFSPAKRGITKSLKKFLIEEKIPKDERNKLPLLTNGSEVIWIIGKEVSGGFNITEQTKNILFCKIG